MTTANDAMRARGFGTGETASGQRPWWPRVRPWLVAAFFGAAAVAIGLAAREVQWRQVWETVQGYRAGTLLMAAGLTVVSHLLYTTYELLARAHVGHRLPWRQVMGVAFVSYAFNLNLGAVIGAAGLRYRLYSRLGLHAAAISQVIAFSIATNWIGYAALAGVVFASGAITPPPGWMITSTVLRGLGLVLLAVGAGYPLACLAARGRTIAVRGLRIEAPPVRIALLQLTVAVANWLLIGTVVYVLLPEGAAFGTVLGVELLSAVAAVVAHIPAGLGVLEGTYVLLLGDTLGAAAIIGAILAFRAVYYLAPLVVALGVYAVLEWRARRRD